MARLDVYLRSIKQLGAQGAVLTSGQAVTLRFPTGDRHATQITSHEQVMSLVREITPPAVLDQIDKTRAVKFEIEASGGRWSIQVAPKPGIWHVTIDPTGDDLRPVAEGDGANVGEAPRATLARGNPGGAGKAVGGASSRDRASPMDAGSAELAIERGPHSSSSAVIATSSSSLLDQLTAGARAVSASDVYLSAGSAAFLRVGGELAQAMDRAPIDGDTLSRELGLVAPTEARSAWTERGNAVFAYGDGAGRVRVTLSRDQRGPGATLRLLPAEAPTLAALGLTRVAEWLSDRGLIAVAGPSGAGKTTILAALVRAIGEQRRRVVAIEHPIEIVHVSAWISQRAVGEHVASVGEGVVAAMREGADAIVIGAVQTAGDAAAVIEAVAGGHLVLTTLVAPRAGVAVEHMIDRLAVEQRELARALCADALLGTIGPIVTRSGRSFEVAGRGIVS